MKGEKIILAIGAESCESCRNFQIFGLNTWYFSIFSHFRVSERPASLPPSKLLRIRIILSTKTDSHLSLRSSENFIEKTFVIKIYSPNFRFYQFLSVSLEKMQKLLFYVWLLFVIDNIRGLQQPFSDFESLRGTSDEKIKIGFFCNFQKNLYNESSIFAQNYRFKVNFVSLRKLSWKTGNFWKFSSSIILLKILNKFESIRSVRNPQSGGFLPENLPKIHRFSAAFQPMLMIHDYFLMLTLSVQS